MHQSHIIAVELLCNIFLNPFAVFAFILVKALFNDIEMHFLEEDVTKSKVWNLKKLSIRRLQA